TIEPDLPSARAVGFTRPAADQSHDSAPPARLQSLVELAGRPLSLREPGRRRSVILCRRGPGVSAMGLAVTGSLCADHGRTTDARAHVEPSVGHLYATLPAGCASPAEPALAAGPAHSGR